MTIKHIYLLLAVLGLILPYSQFLPWVFEYGLDIPQWLADLFANRISSFFALDVVVSATVLLIFIVSEGQRLQMRRLWLPILATLTVGVSCGLPLFLYLRELQVRR